MMVKKLALIPIVRNSKTLDNDKSAIQKKQSISNDHVTTKTYGNKTAIENSKIKQDIKEIAKVKETTMSGRQWYVPIHFNIKCGNTTKATTELETKQVSDLKALALCKVIEVMNTYIVTNDQDTYDDRALATQLTKEVLTSQIQCLKGDNDIVKEATGNTEKPVIVGTLVENVNIPNLTREQLVILKQNDDETNIEEKTPYRLGVEENKINKKKHTDVSVTNILPEPYLCEPKKRKTKGQQQESNSTANLERVQKTTDNSRIPSDILLEKFTLNNNDSTENKNCSTIKNIAKAPKLTVAKVLQNAFVDSGNLKTKLVNTVSAVNNADSPPKIAEAIDLTKDDTNDQYDDKTNKVSGNAKVNCKNINTKIPEDSNAVSLNKDDLGATMSTANLEFVVKTTDSSRTPGDILLENLTLNCDSTKNKNCSMIKDIVTTPSKSTIANVFQNPFTDSGNLKTKHIDNTVSAVNNIVSSAKIVETIDVTKDTNYQYDDNTNKVSDTAKPNCKNINSKIPKDTNAVSVNKDNFERLWLTNNDAESVAASETIQNNKHSISRVKSNENVNVVCNYNVFKINSDSKTYPNDKSKDCEILEDSITTIIINSEDESPLLNSDEEIESSEKIMLEIGKNSSTPVPFVVENEVQSKDKSKYDTIDAEPTQPVFIQERKRPSVDSDIKPTDHLPKKCKLISDFKKVYILPKDYPQTGIDIAKAREFQSAILKSIDYTREALPLLMCQGVKNGGLVYSCQDEKSLFFLEKLVKTMDSLKLIYDFDIEESSTHKMAFRIGFLDEPVSEVFNRLELYNSDLNTSKWKVIKKEHCGDFNVIYVVVDEQSFNYVCYANFILYAGNDCAKFSIVWV